MDTTRLFLDFCLWFFSKFIGAITGIKPFSPSIFWPFFGGLGTILAILLTYYLYRKNRDIREKAQINAIIDEIYHNLNLATGRFAGERTRREIKLIISEMNKLSQVDRYPNPNDSSNSAQKLFSAYEGYDQRTFFDASPTTKNMMPYKHTAISQAMATGTAIILGRRVFLNLGHLEYSLKRLNLVIDKWNALNKDSLDEETRKHHIEGVKQEYFFWLHFRLLFTLLDIFQSYPLKDIYDQNTRNFYKELAGSSWKGR